MRTMTIEIETGITRLFKKLSVIQHDSGRILNCIITDMTIPAGSSARIYVLKPSGAEIYNDCTIIGNTVEVALTTQMLAEVGIAYCQIEITKTKKTVTSCEFSLEVNRSLVSDGAIESTNEFTALEEALSDVEELRELGKELKNPIFVQAATRENINSGENLNTILGKIKKWFADLGTAAFCTIVNNATTTVANTVLDGRMGKILMDKINELNTNYPKSIVSSSITSLQDFVQLTIGDGYRKPVFVTMSNKNGVIPLLPTGTWLFLMVTYQNPLRAAYPIDGKAMVYHSTGVFYGTIDGTNPDNLTSKWIQVSAI